MNAMQISYSAVTEQRGQSRIWLEGGRLEKAGFAHGEAFTSTLNLDTKTLTLDLNFMGDRQVSGRKRKAQDGHTPILDLCNADIATLVGAGERVKVAFYEGRIEISLHHEERDRVHRENRTRTHLDSGIVKTGTLCAGAGISTAALHDGLKAEGLQSQCEWLVDMEGRYLEIADQNNHAVSDKTRLLVGTLEEIETKELSEVDILSVSLSCTIHAACGKAKKGLAIAEEDNSITSMFGLVRIIKATLPSVIVSENVTEAMHSASYLMLKAELQRLGYRISETVLNSDQAGTIENRERYWFVAVSKGLPAVKLEDLMKEPRRFNTVGEIIDDTPETREAFRHFEYLDAKEKRDIAAGKGFRQQLFTMESAQVGCIGRGYSKIRSTEPKLAGEDGKSRLFTVAEHMRLKGIPEHLLSGCTWTLGHEAAGQSILYGHAVGIGKLTAKTLL